MAAERGDIIPDSPGGQACPDAQLVAAYVDGTLSPEVRLEVEEHLVDCDACRAIVAEASLFAQEAAPVPLVPRTTPTARPRLVASRAVPLLALAAAIALSAWLAPTSVRRWLTGTSDGQEMQSLMRAVSRESTRPVTGRLSGGFAYAPPPSSVRGGEAARMVSPEVRVAAAAIERAAPRQGADGQAALGVAYLVSGDLDAAIAALEAATTREPDRASWWNDLAVAYLARGERGRSEADAARALEASDRSLRLSPQMPEAAFNRALALTGLGRLDDASSSWSAAERLSSGSPWAAEAGTHLSPGGRRP